MQELDVLLCARELPRGQPRELGEDREVRAREREPEAREERQVRAAALQRRGVASGADDLVP